MSYEIKKKLFGNFAVHYSCERCKHELESPLVDAGKNEPCPVCNTPLIVPGIIEKNALEVEKANAKSTREIDKLLAKEAQEKASLERHAVKQQKKVFVNKSTQKGNLYLDSQTGIGHNTESGDAKCPFCLEPIIQGAKKCKHCGEYLDTNLRQKRTYSPKSRWVYVVLGLLFGCVGVHNFYAGYRGMAIAQLLITILTCGFAAPLTVSLAVVEVCITSKDGDGYPMG